MSPVPWHVRLVADSLRMAIEHAKENGGVITRSEAIALGMSPTTIRRRVAEGVFMSLRRGVLALPGAVDTHLLDLHAACRKLNATVSHQSAAYVHHLDRPRQVTPTVSVPVRRTKDLVGVTVHQSTDLAAEHVVEVDGLPVTSPERTVVDLAAVISKGHLARILDNGLAASRVDFDGLTQIFNQLGRRGKPGTAKLRSLLDERSASLAPPESELEHRLLAIIDRAGLPPPVRQFHAPWLRSINGRIDLAYPPAFLVIEADSRRWHALMQGFETDRLRDNAAQLAGWRILRFTWKEIDERPERVIGTIRSALEHERI